MSDCPSCHRGNLREVIEYATACCNVASRRGAPAVCPECGQVSRRIHESDRYYECGNCGFVEVARGRAPMSPIG